MATFFFEFLEILLFFLRFTDSFYPSEELRVLFRASVDFFFLDSLLPESLKALREGTTFQTFLSLAMVGSETCESAESFRFLALKLDLVPAFFLTELFERPNCFMLCLLIFLIVGSFFEEVYLSES